MKISEEDKIKLKAAMAIKKAEINAGGVNGSGKGTVNTNSKEYKALQQAIIEHSKKQSQSDRARYDLIVLKCQQKDN